MLAKSACLAILLVGQVLCFITSKLPAIKTLITSAEFPDLGKDTNLLRSSVGLENTTLWFVECDHVPEKTWRDCRFLIGTSSFDNKTRWDSCGFQIENSPNVYHVESTLRSYRLGPNKYLLSWMDFDSKSTITSKQNKIPNQSQVYIKFVAIEIVMNHNQEIGCKANDFQTVVTYFVGNQYQLWQTLTIHLYNDSFDVIYMNNGRDSGRSIRERFDMKGNRLLGPFDLEQSVVDETAVTVAPNWVSELTSNDFYTLYSQERLRLTTSHGEKVFRDLIRNDDLERFRGWSTTNGFVGICMTTKWFSWNCNQTQSGGAAGSQSYTFQVRFTYAPQTQMIYNLPGGGLLTMTSDRKKQDKTGKHFSSFYMTKFDSSGRLYKPIKFAEIDTSSSMLLGHFFEDEDGNYCFALLHKWGDSRFIAKCYNDEALTQ